MKRRLKMTEQIDIQTLKRLFPNATKSTFQANDTRVHTSFSKHLARPALERIAPRKDASGPRFEIRFRIYAIRPCDWINYAIGCKIIEDFLIGCFGILDDDSWRTVQGSISSQKAHTKAEERLEVEIVSL